MEDSKIIELYWQRDENAIEETKKSYGGYCYSIAYNILAVKEDSEEAVNDTYMGVWNAIPPHRPTVFSSFIAKITRNIAIKKLRYRTAEKRGGVTEELTECIPHGETVDRVMETKELSCAVDRFLRTLKSEERVVFLRRYFFFDPVCDIAKRTGSGESRIKMMLKRTRQKLRTYLEKEGIYL